MMNLSSLKKKTQKFFFGLLLTLSLVVGVNSNCEAFSISIRFPAVDNLLNVARNQLSAIESQLASIRSINDFVKTIVTIATSYYKFLLSAGVSPTDKSAVDIQSSPDLQKNSTNMTQQQTTKLATYSSSTDRVGNQLAATAQTGTAPSTQQVPGGTKGETVTYSSTSSSILNVKQYENQQQSDVATQFTAHSTGAYFGANQVEMRPGVAVTPEQLQANAVSKSLTANQSIAQNSQVKMQAAAVTQNGSGSSGSSLRSNNWSLMMGPHMMAQFWTAVMSGDFTSLMTLVRGVFTYYFSMGSLIFQMADSLGDLSQLGSGVLSMLVVTGKLLLETPLTQQSMLALSPASKMLKKTGLF